MPRPQEFSKIYPEEFEYAVVDETTIKKRVGYKIVRYELSTAVGDVTVDYYRSETSSPVLIFVFPILKGRNLVAKHFAEYFVEQGIETALIHRHDGFKNPEEFDRIEEVMRETVQRDRTVLTFFEKQFGKSRFGGFGISRGAINLSMTAGVDPRIECVVLAMGGADIPDMYVHSDSGHIGRYRREIRRRKGYSVEEFYSSFKDKLETDPNRLGRYIGADNVLMFLALLDSTVPFRNGLKLRRELGEPETIYLLSGHYSSALYTQVIPLLLPVRGLRMLPFDIVEQEALSFFRSKLDIKKPTMTPALALYRIMRLPVDLMTQSVKAIESALAQ